MITLRPYQEEGLNAIWNYFVQGGKGHPVLSWPTGTGKSVLPAVFIERIMKIYPTQRFMLITHVKELISQNAEVLRMVWPTAPLGIYSAGLKSRDIAFPIIYAGIQSAIKNPPKFGHRDIIFIDEAHLVNQEESSMYQTFLATMKLINPCVKIIGMTATPFRMGQGMITDEGIFTDIIHDLCSMDGFNNLIHDKFLCPLIPLRTRTELDVSDVGIRNHEFIPGQLQGAVDKQEITYAGLKELVHAGQNRRSWLIFSSGIEHAEHIAAMLTSFGVDCAAVHSKQKPEYNDAAIRAFKANKLRSIVNFSKLTTGFNHPDIDLIGDFRPTMSIPLHVQKLGRGTRPASGKDNCLVLDFSRNVPRLGPINDPIIPRKKGEKTGDPPIKICENCGAYNHASVRRCCQCDAEFTFKVKIVAKPGHEEIIKSDLPVIESFDVKRVTYLPHQKTGSPPCMRVCYYTGLQMFQEFIMFEHGGMPAKRARDWWRQVHKTEPPKTTKEALQYSSQLRPPRKIRVWCNKKYPEVLSREF